MKHKQGRQLNKQSKGKQTNYVYSHKEGKHLWVDQGRLESLVLLDFEFRDDIHRIVSQPIRLQFPNLETGELVGYTPDFALIGNNVDDYIEAKLSKYARGESFESLMASARTHLWKTQKRTLGVITEHDIASGDRLKNYKLLVGYKRLQPLVKLDLLQIETALGKQTTLFELSDYLTKLNISSVYAYALLAHKLVQFDWDSLISNTMTLEFI